MMALRRLAALGCMCALLVGIIQIGGPLASFLDFWSVFFVVGMTLLGSLVSFSLSEMYRSLFCFDSEGAEEAEHKARVLDRMAEVAFVSGFVGLLIGLIHIFSQADLRQVEVLGPAFGVALLTPLYGLILGRLLFAGLASEHRTTRFDEA